MNTTANTRKAAILLRSLDADTAAMMLSQLTETEAAAVRTALRELGPLDQEEQADVAAEFRRVRPMVGEGAPRAVELALSADVGELVERIDQEVVPASPQRFDFLIGASTSTVVAMLVREHAQTIAVVLAHLAPERAAAILAALPERVQADTVERLSVLGETDPESVTVIERELALWLGTRTQDRGAIARRRESVNKILAAADPKTRRSIMSKLKIRSKTIADRISPYQSIEKTPPIEMRESSFELRCRRVSQSNLAPDRRRPSRGREIEPAPSARPSLPPQLEFDQLVHFDAAALSALLREVDANVLALALAGSGDELVDRITAQMPKRIARTFRRELRRLGPTKLSDVTGAQRIVADTASQFLARRSQPLTSVAR